MPSSLRRRQIGPEEAGGPSGSCFVGVSDRFDRRFLGASLEVPMIKDHHRNDLNYEGEAKVELGLREYCKIWIGRSI